MASIEQMYFNAVEAAAFSGFSSRTIARAIAAGDLQAAKVRGQYRINRDELVRWLNG